VGLAPPSARLSPAWWSARATFVIM
jgi:hypothetical protein